MFPNRRKRKRRDIRQTAPVIILEQAPLDPQRYAPHSLRLQVLARDKYQCYYCHRKITNDTANMDHRVPWKRRGQTILVNLVASCQRCNKAKGNMTVNQYKEYLRKPKRGRKRPPLAPDWTNVMQVRFVR